MCVCVVHVKAGACGGQRHWIPWKGSFRGLRATCCGRWEPSSGSLGEQSALNLSNPQAKILKNYFFIFQDYNTIILFFPFPLSKSSHITLNAKLLHTYISTYLSAKPMVHIELHNFNGQHRVYNCLIFPTVLLLVKSRVYFQSASSGGSPRPVRQSIDNEDRIWVMTDIPVDPDPCEQRRRGLDWTSWGLLSWKSVVGSVYISAQHAFWP